MTMDYATRMTVYGNVLGISFDDMEEITMESAKSASVVKDGNVIDTIKVVTDGFDPKVLWRGAMMYAYLVESYAVGKDME